MELIPNAREVFDIAYNHGAYGVYISGAGPTIAAIADEMKFSLDNAGLNGWQVREFHIYNNGTQVISE